MSVPLVRRNIPGLPKAWEGWTDIMQRDMERHAGHFGLLAGVVFTAAMGLSPAVLAQAPVAPARFGAAPIGSGYSPAYGRESIWNRLEPIDPGTSDVGHLGLQTRVLNRHMLTDHDCGLLYRAMTETGSAVFARRDAGVTALFPRSAYAETSIGDFSLIPPGTTFVIGEPAAAFSQSMGLLGPRVSLVDPSGGLRMDSRLGSGAGSASAASDWGRNEAETPRRGVGALLRAAARNERRAAGL